VLIFIVVLQIINSDTGRTVDGVNRHQDASELKMLSDLVYTAWCISVGDKW